MILQELGGGSDATRKGHTMPKSKHDSLAYILKKNAIENSSQIAANNDKIDQCKTAIDNFCAWAKEQGYTREEVEGNAEECLRKYAISVLMAPARGLGVSIENWKGK